MTGPQAQQAGAAAPQVEGLIALARSRSPGDREKLLLTLADLYSRTPQGSAAETRQVLSDIFMGLVASAEHDIRLRLAERLAPAAWAPHDLIVLLARDDIEIARPVIAESPILTEHDLVRLLVECAIEHQIEVARRPRLGPEVVRVVVDQGQPEVLAALAGNPSADLSPLALSRLVSFSEQMAALRAPLARHPLLTSDLAGLLYGWVGESLRAALATRFQDEGEALGRAVAQSVQDLHGGPPMAVPLEAGENLADRREAADSRAAMEARVVEKLQAAGQLRPGLLIRALHEGKLQLFTTALAALGGFAPEAVRAAIDSSRPDRLADACSAVGIDRSAFPTVLSLLRRLNDGRPGGEAGPDGLDPGEDADAKDRRPRTQG